MSGASISSLLMRSSYRDTPPLAVVISRLPPTPSHRSNKKLARHEIKFENQGSKGFLTLRATYRNSHPRASVQCALSKSRDVANACRAEGNFSQSIGIPCEAGADVRLNGPLSYGDPDHVVPQSPSCGDSQARRSERVYV